MTKNQYLEELNDKQKKAVTSPRQPVLVIAGPGTGKTRTLIARIIYEINQHHIPPEQILALTFSNKAIAEMRQRLHSILPQEAQKVKVSTFHSFCLEVLRRYTERAGLHKYFCVCDDAYQTRLITTMLVNRVRSHPERKVQGIKLAFSNHILKDKELPPFSALLFDEYEAYLDKHHLIDFNQILARSRDLLRRNKDILKQYRFMYQAILVDEFQDTDPIQYEIVRMLAEEHRNIFVVADDDQSIYAWRGARPQNIRQYMQDFNITKPIFLEQNYRCGAEIMETAQLIVQETDRVEPDKTINGAPDHSAKIRAYFFQDESQEIRFIVKKVTDWQKNHGVDYGDMAVIYPRHVLGEKLSAYLLQKRIPFQQAEGRNLADHPLMKKVLLYLKLIRDPSDTFTLEELVEQELGATVYRQLQELQRINQIPFKKALNELASRDELSYKVRNQLQTFIGNIANLINLKSFFSFQRLMNEIIRSMRNLNATVLQSNLKRLKPIKVEKSRQFYLPETKIWVYHSDRGIQFLANQLLERMLGRQIYNLDQEKVVHIQRSDFAVLLEPFDIELISCSYAEIYQLSGERRRGILSSLFRWIQEQLATEERIFKNYVVFDLETTGKNTDSCGIVEIAAVKVRDGKIVDEFQTLVNPGIAIEKEAQAVHHITESDLEEAPGYEDIWPRFGQFIGQDLLIAHNGYHFDFKIIDRVSRQLNQPRFTNVRYDSLILARNLFPNQQNSIDGLVERFHLDAGTRHRALDDVRVLHEIFLKLIHLNHQNEIRTGGEEFTEFVALGNVLENTLSAVEDRIYFFAGIRKLLSPFSSIRKNYAQKFALNDEELKTNLLRIKDRLAPGATVYDSYEQFYNKILETSREFNDKPVEEAIAEFLSFLALMGTQDNLEKINAVSLLTFHAAKGLEFDRVIITGMEDENMPSFFAYKSDDDDDRPVSQKLEEQKRLLYVGMTRGKREVIFSIVKNRAGRQQKSSPFLDEIRHKIEIRHETYE